MLTLDTSFLIDLIRHDSEAMRTLAAMEWEGLPLATTAINALELYRGAFLSASMQANLRKSKRHGGAPTGTSCSAPLLPQLNRDISRMLIFLTVKNSALQEGS